MKTKITLLTALASGVLAWSAFGQEPSATPPAVATPAVAAPTVPPVAVPTATAKDDLESQIERKVNGHGVHIQLGPDHTERAHKHDDSDDLGGLIAIPIVGIIFGTMFLSPVFIVGVILLFNYMKQRSLHRTVRMMVEKGQPVPAELFAATPRIRARNDMRRGVVLIMVGLGIMVFLGAVNDWEGGSWAIGMIPFLIGAGYLTVWKLEGNKPGLTNGTTNTSTDIPPRVP